MLALLFFASTALAGSGGSYALEWNSVDGGGATYSTGGLYQLGGMAGQPEAGDMSGGVYSLTGGYWSGDTMIRTYLPLTLKPN